MQNLKRNFILIGLIVLAVFIPFQDIMAADCKDILIYMFAENAAFYRSDFSSIESHLEANGYNVTFIFTRGGDRLTPALISSYGQIWIMDTGSNWMAIPINRITPAEVDNLVNHYNTGNSILLAGTGEDKYTPSFPDVRYRDDVNLIAQRFNTSMAAKIDDGTEICLSTVNQTGNIHSSFLLNGVSTIGTVGNDTGVIGNIHITTTNPNVFSVAASSTGFNIIYALDGTIETVPKGRIIFHPSFFTFINGGDCDASRDDPGLAVGNSKQYAKNVADWFCGLTLPPTCNISASPNPINIGDSVTLTWTSTGADTVDSSNFGAAGVSGSTTVSPTSSSTTYNLTVSGASGIGSCSVVVITTLPPISGGLIPCGRKTDNPDTPNVNEKDECTVCHFFLMIKNIMDFITKIAVIVAILFISLGGIMYVLSTGNEAMLSKAKAMITYAIIGFILIFAAWLMIELILSTFGYTNPLGGEWDVIC